MTDAIASRLVAEGQPVTTVDLTSANRPAITSSFLVGMDYKGAHARFSGVVAPNEAPSQLSAGERQLLADYELAFKVRQVSAYTWAHPEVGLNYAANPGYVGAVDGMRATVTASGAADAFSYLKGVTLDDISPAVAESWGYLATPLAPTADQTFTPLVTATIPGTDTQGSLIGVFNDKGREQLVMTFASNKSQNHWKELSHGVVRWLTRGISTTFNRNYLAVHIDDVLLPDALWSEDGNCTIGDGCDPVAYPETAPGATTRMTASDVQRLLSWQNASGIKLDMVYNGSGAADFKADNGSDPLEANLLAAKGQLRFVNHTWSHPYLGCVQDFTKVPWQCAKDAAGRIQYATASTITTEINKNKQYATANALGATSAGYGPGVLVTGEHSGLKTLPQMSVDNPNLATALTLTGINWVASDASRESSIRTIGSATTVPRYPMNIYYNTDTKSQAVDEYNWIYTSAANGGSGMCEQNPATMTCITPLSKDTGFDGFIVPIEARIALGHLLGNDPRPHYAHQSNLAADGILYPVLDRVIATYRGDFAATAPLVNPTMRESGEELVRQSAWSSRTSSIAATISGTTVSVRNSSLSTVTVPLTLPAGARAGASAFGSSYGGEQSSWINLGGLGTRTYTLPAASGFATSVTWPVAPAAPTGTPNLAVEKQVATKAIPVNLASSKVIEAAEPPK